MDPQLPAEVQQQLDRFKQQLVEEFDGVLPAHQVTECAQSKLKEFQDARVLSFVPLLVYRYAREDLDQSTGETRAS